MYEIIQFFLTPIAYTFEEGVTYWEFLQFKLYLTISLGIFTSVISLLIAVVKELNR